MKAMAAMQGGCAQRSESNVRSGLGFSAREASDVLREAPHTATPHTPGVSSRNPVEIDMGRSVATDLPRPDPDGAGGIGFMGASGRPTVTIYYGHARHH